jgi:hypothetical protein
MRYKAVCTTNAWSSFLPIIHAVLVGLYAVLTIFLYSASRYSTTLYSRCFATPFPASSAWPLHLLLVAIAGAPGKALATAYHLLL